MKPPPTITCTRIGRRRPVHSARDGHKAKPLAGVRSLLLETIRNLCRRHDVAVMYVSHDLAVVSSLADRVAVMYGGRIVEAGSRDEIFANPRHPYTRRLLRAVPTSTG